MVVPREPLEMQIIRKTAKLCTMMRAEPEHSDYGLKSVLLSFDLNSKYPLFCLYLFSLLRILSLESVDCFGASEHY